MIKGKIFSHGEGLSYRAGETEDGVQSRWSPVFAEGVGSENEARRDTVQVAWEDR